jgi:NADPH-dependent 2,4-dienoyl-CoA reductase/sulfur reductase-like enzyme/nitrite reductase/ring-hydroxylating ferredoxin subunit
MRRFSVVPLAGSDLHSSGTVVFPGVRNLARQVGVTRYPGNTMSDDQDHNLDLTQWIEVEAAPDGRILAGVVGEDRVFVWRSGNRLKAYSADCPHLGGPLDEGIIAAGATIRCPWHHACFDLATGEATAAPAFDALLEYPVTFDNDRFCVKPAHVQTPRRTGRREDGPGTMAIVGGGSAGFAAADAIRRLGWRGGVSIFSEEREQPYDRTLLTKDYLEGSFGDDRLPIARHSLAGLGVDFEGGESVQHIEPGNKRLSLANGDERPYEKLLLATGATPRRLDVPGGDLPHVMMLRSLQDCRRILANVTSGARVAVVGGSFIAMEAAASLMGRGLSVDVIAPEEHPLEKVFGRELSDLVLEAHSRKGVRLHLGSRVARIEDKQVLLQGGERIDADIVVVGIGVEPRLQLAKAAELTLDRGVVVNSRLQTSDPNIFAAGDIARWPDPHTGENIRVEHWVVAERQGQVAAANMLGRDQSFTMVPFFWTKHFDLSIRYVGHAEKWDETLVEGDLAHRNGLVRFRRAGRDLAVATVERDKDSLRAELAMEGEPQRSS